MLYLARRPVTDSLRALSIWFGVVVAIEIALGASIPLGGDAKFCMLFGSAAAVMATIMPFIIRSEAHYKRDYPEKLENFLNQELSVKDYKAIYKTARAYPTLRPMVASAMQDGKLYYRQAEGLVEQINVFLTEHDNGRHRLAGSPQQKLEKLVRQSPLGDAPPQAGRPPPDA